MINTDKPNNKRKIFLNPQMGAEKITDEIAKQILPQKKEDETKK